MTAISTKVIILKTDRKLILNRIHSIVYTKDMYIAILGRQPALGMAELERLYGAPVTRWFSKEAAIVDAPGFDFERLGGTQKAGRVVAELRGDWVKASRQIVSAYTAAWADSGSKITLGISAYGFTVSARDVQKTGVVLKSKLKHLGVSIRLVPNAEPALNTATSHHNKLGLSHNKVELLVVRAANGAIIVAESVGAQNITALAARDQGRPKRDAFVGMLPPKLARMMINLCGPLTPGGLVWDPFCGTGVIMQEALLLGLNAYGTDLSDKMIDYTRQNLDWLMQKAATRDVAYRAAQADAMEVTLPNDLPAPLAAITCESYLGQPFSAPPSPAKLQQVVGNCNHIISEFLKNIHPQLPSHTSLCVAVPAWRSTEGSFTHLPLTDTVQKLGYERIILSTVRPEQLLYYRENQVVARELLLLQKQ